MRPSLQRPHLPRKRDAFTLIEMMISVVAGFLILASVCCVYVFMSRNLDATANYEELDRQSRNAIDTMGRDIRQAGAMISFATNTIWFTNQDSTMLRYTWDAASGNVYYTNASVANGGPYGGILLKNCSYLNFSIFQRTPSNGTTMDFWPTTNPALAKVVLINWVCARTNYTSLKNSESVQTAKVVLRN